MSARPMSKSAAKLARWKATAELDAAAKELAAREGITFMEALGRVYMDDDFHREGERAKEQR